MQCRIDRHLSFAYHRFGEKDILWLQFAYRSFWLRSVWRTA